MVIGAPGEGQVKLDHSICIWDHFLKRFQIWTEKFEIPIVAPNIAKSVIIGKYDQLHLGWFDLYLDLILDEIQNLQTKSL